MARNIGMTDGRVYRAVITKTYAGHDGEPESTVTHAEGPYTTAGAALGRVSFWRNLVAGSLGWGHLLRAEGHVETAELKWEPVE
jgi:hypothetical protein